MMRAKLAYVQRINKHLISTRHMLHGMQTLTNYKPNPHCSDRDSSYPDKLNNFFARFDAQNREPVRKAEPPFIDQVLDLSTGDVRTLYRINPCKAAGPDNIPGQVLKEGANWLETSQTFSTHL